MVAPDAPTIRALSKVDFSSLGLGDDTDLQVVVDQAVAYVGFVTARPCDDTMPTVLEPIARQAIRMRTEQVAYQQQEDYVEGASDDIVGSFSAGNYSETRHDPTRRGETRALNTWPALSELLWLMLSDVPGQENELVDARREYWQSLLTGVNAPAFAVTEVDWANYGGYPEIGLDPRSGYPAYGGPQWAPWAPWG